MALKNLSNRWILLVTIPAGCLLSLAIFLSPLVRKDSRVVIENTAVFPTQNQPLSTPELPSYGLPVNIKIPTINVDTIIEHVGLSSDGAMDAPKERANAAWFNMGPRPGENGSAVISGHYGWQNMQGSAFDDLHKLNKGDKIYIEDENGETISFVVREIRRFSPETKKSDNADIFGFADGKSHLNLITCEGAWDEKTQQYTKRLVVFTDKEM